MSYLGATTRLGLETEGLRLHAVVPAGAAAGLAPGQAVEAAFAPESIHLMEDAP